MTIKKYFFLTTLFIMSLIPTACDKLPENGSLDGMWQLMEIKEGSETKNMKDKRLYCSFQLNVILLGDRIPRHYFGYFERKNNVMRFYHFTYRSEYLEGNHYDKIMTDEEDLDVIAPWGFYSTDCSFDIVKQNRSELILQHGDTIITYRKF